MEENYILITGGCGYIGSQTAVYIKENSNFIPIILDFNINQHSTKILENQFNIQVFEGNINDEKILKMIYSKYPFKSVMHFAAFIEAGESVLNPEKYYKNNVENFRIFLDAVCEFNLKNFIFSSSAAVYGGHHTKSIEEDDSKIPINPYGETKLKGEELLKQYSDKYNFNGICLRYFNASGNREDCLLGEDHEPETHLIPKLITNVLNGKSVSVFGNDYDTFDKTCIRDYIHINDLADGHLKALLYSNGKEKLFDYFNLGSGNGFSILEVISALEKVLNIEKITINYENRREGDPATLVACSKKAEKILKWIPKYDIVKIVENAYEYHMNKKKRNEINSKFKELYGKNTDYITKAAGRIEIIGNHTDYNLGPVIGMTINKYIYVAIANLHNNENQNENILEFCSEIDGFNKHIIKDINDFDTSSWIKYPIAVYKSLLEKNLIKRSNFKILVLSDLPSGSGLSSSAAIELATAFALMLLSKNKVDLNENMKMELINSCIYAENHFVGVPCGMLDQGTISFGKNNNLVHIECKDKKIKNLILPESFKNIKFWIFNTHKKHELINSLYKTRFNECMESCKILKVNSLSEIDLNTIKKIDNNDIDLKRAIHVVEEIDRVRSFEKILSNESKLNDDEKLKELGKLLFESHNSSRINFENSTKELDFIVDLLSLNKMVYGARLTGGGFGGAVMVITNNNFRIKDANEIDDKYFNNFGSRLDIISVKSSDGLQEFL